MIPYERKLKIVEIVNEKEFIFLEDLQQYFDVSESTLRRDLKELESEDYLVNLRGGGIIKKQGYYDTTFSTRSNINISEKEIIAKEAAKLVKNGHVIFIDSGTTTLLMLEHLAHLKITLVTTNIPVYEKLQNTDITCIFIGGRVLADVSSMVGVIAEKALSNIFFDLAFLGATGLDDLSGVNTNNIEEAKIKQIAFKNSKKTFVLADSSKIGVRSSFKAIELDKAITVITDEDSNYLKERTNYLVAK